MRLTAAAVPAPRVCLRSAAAAADVTARVIESAVVSSSNFRHLLEADLRQCAMRIKKQNSVKR
jgi:hypothetical protein